MADRSTYREIMTRLFLKGESPATITYKGSDGKMHRLAEPGSGSVPKTKISQAKALYDQLRQAKTAARDAHEVVSPGDG